MFANDIDNLAKCVSGRAKVTNKIYFIKNKYIPENQKETYGKIVVYYYPQKEDPYRTHLAVGVNLINRPGDFGTPTADILTSKLLFNSMLSTPYAKFMGIDIKNFYLYMPMP